MKVVITGGSGFLGLSLAKALCGKDVEVTIISRNKPAEGGPWNFIPWDAQTLGSWVEALEGADAVVNVVGKSVNCRKTPDNCDLILRSRVDSTRLIGKALRTLTSPPDVWVQMSTAHIYGDPPSITCTEDSSHGYGLAPDVALAWESAFHESVLPDMRQVIVRPSFILGNEGGALATLRTITKLGLGGKISHGNQGMSWLHIDDMNNIFIKALEDDNMSGVYIASSPEPLPQKIFMKTLRKVMRQPFALPASEWMVRVGAPLVMNTDPEMILYGRYLQPKRLLEEGFEFKFPNLEGALADLV